MTQIISSAEWKPRGIEELEPNAELVVRSPSNFAVTADPGTGKTELLAQRASFLLETGCCPYPRRILAVSFKRDAARNLRERVRDRSGEGLAGRFDSFTFDGFSKSILDQFRSVLPVTLRPDADYEVAHSIKPREVEAVLRAATPPRELGLASELQRIAKSKSFSQNLHRLYFDREPSSLKLWAKRELWRVMIHDRHPSRLSFPMIGRLAAEVVRSDARVRRAYRATYSHVFLDEFQDTTRVHYWLTVLLFRGTRSVVTAVGDPKQCIMTWAGAAPEIFPRFVEDFGAEETQLHQNHRASKDVASVVSYVAKRLLTGTAGTGACAGADLLEDVGDALGSACAAHVFEDEADEAGWMAKEIDQTLQTGVSPRDVGVLVRSKASEYGARVMQALAATGRSARVEDDPQKLLAEPIVEGFMLALRALACDAPGSCWSEFRSMIAASSGIERSDEKGNAELERSLTAVRRALRAAAPSALVEPHAMRALLEREVAPTLAPLRRRHGRYRQGTFYEQVVAQLADALTVAVEMETQPTWSSVLDRVEGRDAVPILTIHKSKGLEYHSVFFIGLEDDAFWNFRNNPDEESKAFFVALSRAKQRVAFSFSKSRTRGGRPRRQSKRGIKRLYELMKEAGVPILEHARTW